MIWLIIKSHSLSLEKQNALHKDLLGRKNIQLYPKEATSSNESRMPFMLTLMFYQLSQHYSLKAELYPNKSFKNIKIKDRVLAEAISNYVNHLLIED